MSDSPYCECGEIQTAGHIEDSCPRTKFVGVEKLHKAEPKAMIPWLENLENLVTRLMLTTYLDVYLSIFYLSSYLLYFVFVLFICTYSKF